MLSVLIVGAGSITQSEHLPNWLAQPGARVAGLVGRTPERTRPVADAYGVRYFDSIERALHTTRVDAVHIATATGSHVELTLEVLAAGKHVMLEKPMAESAVEAGRLLDAADASGVVLDVGCQKQADADIEYVAGLVHDGSLGALTGVTSVFRFAQKSVYRRFGPPASPDIPDPADLHRRLVEQSIHHLNVYHSWLAGELVVDSVLYRGGLWQITGTGVDTVFAHTNAAQSGHGEEFLAWFEEGSVRVTIGSPHLPATRHGVEVFEAWADRRYQPVSAWRNPYSVMLERFVEKTQGVRPWRPDVERAVRDHHLIDQIEQRWHTRSSTE